MHLSAAQRRLLESRAGVVVLAGPAGSGKTMALAARALDARRQGRAPLIICSHASGCSAFEEALAALQDGTAPESLRVATLADHAAGFLGAAYLGAGCAPDVAVGGRGAVRWILAHAARGLLDMSWPLFARADIELDLPHLSRPEAFLDEAAGLFTLLQRARVSSTEFEEGCAAGLAAFYGERTERAEALVADPVLKKTASARGRDALRASAPTLAVQRAAERDLAKILAQLYRDYRAAASAAMLRSPADLIESLIRWLERDTLACDAVAASFGEIIVDDAEDAEPALVPFVQAVRKARELPLVLAGAQSSRIDGFEGRRSALNGFEGAQRIDLGPLSAPAQRVVERFSDETDETRWIAQRIGDLLRSGTQPHAIAVLSRSEQAAVLYAKALRELGLPVAMPPAALEREEEIVDLLALCVVLDEPSDQEHLLRVLSSPVVGLNDASLWAMCRDPADGLQLSLAVGLETTSSKNPKRDTLAWNVVSGDGDAALTHDTRARIAELRAQLAAWRVNGLGLSPVQRLLYLASAAGFRAHWDQAAQGERERLHEDCARVAQAVEAASHAGASDFRAIAGLIEDEVVDLAPAARLPGVIVSDTIVGVKGLHFDHVFVAGVAHERFPRIYTSHAMAFSRTYGLIVRENVGRGAAQAAKFAWYYAKFGAKAMYLDEERRALDYGLSRARIGAYATGFGTPPYWARHNDLLTALQSGEVTAGAKDS